MGGGKEDLVAAGSKERARRLAVAGRDPLRVSGTASRACRSDRRDCLARVRSERRAAGRQETSSPRRPAALQPSGAAGVERNRVPRRLTAGSTATIPARGARMAAASIPRANRSAGSVVRPSAPLYHSSRCGSRTCGSCLAASGRWLLAGALVIVALVMASVVDGAPRLDHLQIEPRCRRHRLLRFLRASLVSSRRAAARRPASTRSPPTSRTRLLPSRTTATTCTPGSTRSRSRARRSTTCGPGRDAGRQHHHAAARTHAVSLEHPDVRPEAEGSRPGRHAGDLPLASGRSSSST